MSWSPHFIRDARMTAPLCESLVDFCGRLRGWGIGSRGRYPLVGGAHGYIKMTGLGPLHWHKGKEGLMWFPDRLSKVFLPPACSHREATLNMVLSSFCSIKLTFPTRCNPFLLLTQRILHLVVVGILLFFFLITQSKHLILYLSRWDVLVV